MKVHLLLQSRALLIAVILAQPCLGGEKAPTLDRESELAQKAFAMESRDTTGLLQFVDSLRKDVSKGRLDFLFRNLTESADGGNHFGMGWDTLSALRNDSGYRAATAKVIAWHMKYGGVLIDTFVLAEFGEWVYRFPDLGTVGLKFAEQPSEVFDLSDTSISADKCMLYLAKPDQPLFKQIDGARIGVVGNGTVCKLKEYGGFRPYGYDGKIGAKWMKVRTHAGLVGWTDGSTIRDFRGPGVTLTFVHASGKWWVRQLQRWDEAD